MKILAGVPGSSSKKRKSNASTAAPVDSDGALSDRCSGGNRKASSGSGAASGRTRAASAGAATGGGKRKSTAGAKIGTNGWCLCVLSGQLSHLLFTFS